MMVRVQRGGIMEPPTVLEGVDGVVICTDAGTPIIVGKDMEGKAFVVTATEKSFPLMLRAMGYREEEIPQVKVGSLGG